MGQMIRDIMTPNPLTLGADATVQEAARNMRDRDIGSILVTDGAGMLCGIVTDRDIVVETMALQLDATLFTAGDIMNAPLITVRQSTGFVETLRLMRTHGVRRMPVVTDDGALYGMVTADDIVRLLALELSLITEAMSGQMAQERRLRK